MRLRLFTLGRVRCDLNDQELTDLPGQRLRCALLIYLAVERRASRETIQNLFWSDREDAKGRGALKTTLFELRRLLGDCIQSRGDWLHVDDEVSSDLRDFERLVQAGDSQAALDLYDGAFLQGFSVPYCKPFEFWVDSQRARAARLHRDARSTLISETLEAGSINAAVVVARRWVDLEPLEDEAQHRLIELLAGSGNRTNALRHAENYERVLRDTGLEPLDEKGIWSSDCAQARPSFWRNQSGPP